METTNKTTGENIEDISVESTEDIQVQNAPQANVRVREIRELRGENRKVFQMSDGSKQAVFYPQQIHVKEEATGELEEVANTLTLDEDGGHYRNGRNRFKAAFSCETDNDELFFMECGMHRITVSAKKNSKKRGCGVIPALRTRDGRRNHSTEALVFANIEAGTDMEYSVLPEGVKENIVVKEKAEVYRYPFLLHCENLTVQFEEAKKRVAFLSTESGEEVFHIPAPFMTDANGVVSHEVDYEVKTVADGELQMTVTADSAWLNAEERAFPVTIDPQIMVSGTSYFDTYSWTGGVISRPAFLPVGTNSSGQASRMYTKFTVPSLPRNPRIKKAELIFTQCCGTFADNSYPYIGLYPVTGEITSGTCTPAMEEELIDFERMKPSFCEDEESGMVLYAFDITKFMDKIYKGEADYTGLVLKLVDESVTTENSINLYGTNFSAYVPKISITYESSYGVNTSYRTHSHEIGRFGQGSIDLQCGNLMFEAEDFAWAGNRMPVTIKHLYNSALANHPYTANDAILLKTADFSAMQIGLGWKLNLMQSMVATTFTQEDVTYDGYVFVGENGEEVYFKAGETKRTDANGSQYAEYEDVDGAGMIYDTVNRVIEDGEEKYQFDEAGRLIGITDAHGNTQTITYTLGRITSVTDGAGRDFGFTYTNNFLSAITAPDGTSIRYTYSGSLLHTMTYPDGRKVGIQWTAHKPQFIMLADAAGEEVYRVAYTFSGDRVASVAEYGKEGDAYVVGERTTYDYSAAARRTVVQTIEAADEEEEEANIIKTVYTFDEEGEIVSEYAYTEESGNTGVSGESAGGIHPYAGENGVSVVRNAVNLLVGHDFETEGAWTAESTNEDNFAIRHMLSETYCRYGRHVLRMESGNAQARENGVYQQTGTLPAGDYTFSAYLRISSAFQKTENGGAYLRVTDTAGNVLSESERLGFSDSEFIRFSAPFTLSESKSITVHILADGKGILHAEGAQLENNPYAGAYNLLENGNFEFDSENWTLSEGVSLSEDTRFNMSRSLKMSGDLTAARTAEQRVAVRTARSTRENFTLSGWAKGCGMVNRERCGVEGPMFRLRAVVNYYDDYYKEYGSEEFTADFAPMMEEWQYASVQFAKSAFRKVKDVQVFCDYSYNNGTVYFDDIQLVRDSLEKGLSASDFVTESSGDAEDDTEETTETTGDSAPEFAEAEDAYGNALTETTFTDGEFGSIYRSFGFNADSGSGNAGNDLIRETDERGYETTYTVDEETSRNEEVTDRLGNQTAYVYDTAGRTRKVTSKDAGGTELANVSYTYDNFDNLTEIVRGDGMKYVLAYNTFHNLASIGVDGKAEKLVSYTYKNGNGRLKEVAYANGDVMKATYNRMGQMNAEKWYDVNENLTAHYKYVYDGEGNIVRSIDILNAKEYDYHYEDGKIIRATECDITVNESEMVTAKTLVHTVLYSYDAEDKLTKKRILPADG
ncbi:MAG: hypothetical protein E7269_05230, partial [Lachnospiraceae bacterium]|nr:hypothetical protein [Lachnospiraceae bacterium]